MNTITCKHTIGLLFVLLLSAASTLYSKGNGKKGLAISDSDMSPDYNDIGALAAQPDTRVTTISVGFLTNTSDLLQSSPGKLSPLTGKELVKKKVQKLASMAGAFPSGKEFNIEKDTALPQHVLALESARAVQQI